MASCLLHGVHNTGCTWSIWSLYSGSARALDLPETKTWADCKPCNQTPYCSPTFIMTRAALRCAYLDLPVPVFLSQLSNYQVDNITHAFVIFALRFFWVQPQACSMCILRKIHFYWIYTANSHIGYIMSTIGSKRMCIFKNIHLYWGSDKGPSWPGLNMASSHCGCFWPKNTASVFASMRLFDSCVFLARLMQKYEEDHP